METWNWIILIVACILVVGILICGIVFLAKKGWMKEIKNILEKAIKEAEEKFPESGSGRKKKEYVINAVEEWCKKKSFWMGLLFKAFKAALCGLINTIVSNYNVIAK